VLPSSHDKVIDAVQGGVTDAAEVILVFSLPIIWDVTSNAIKKESLKP